MVIQHAPKTNEALDNQEDGSPVSVFVFDASKQRDKLPFARNALKRFKTIRHPSALHYLDSQEVTIETGADTETSRTPDRQINCAD